jgi:biotin synthase-like enzyme
MTKKRVVMLNEMKHLCNAEQIKSAVILHSENFDQNDKKRVVMLNAMKHLFRFFTPKTSIRMTKKRVVMLNEMKHLCNAEQIKSAVILHSENFDQNDKKRVVMLNAMKHLMLIIYSHFERIRKYKTTKY